MNSQVSSLRSHPPWVTLYIYVSFCILLKNKMFRKILYIFGKYTILLFSKYYFFFSLSLLSLIRKPSKVERVYVEIFIKFIKGKVFN